MVDARRREDGQRALRAPRPQELRRRVPVVARLDGDVEHLLERVDARLAALELDDVEDLLRVGEHEVVEAQEHGGALLQALRRAHSACASRAAAQAASTSAGQPLGTSASTAPVNGASTGVCSRRAR